MRIRLVIVALHIVNEFSLKTIKQSLIIPKNNAKQKRKII